MSVSWWCSTPDCLKRCIDGSCYCKRHCKGRLSKPLDWRLACTPPPSLCPVLELPVELLLRILHTVDSLQDLANILLTCTVFASLLTLKERDNIIQSLTATHVNRGKILRAGVTHPMIRVARALTCGRLHGPCREWVGAQDCYSLACKYTNLFGREHGRMTHYNNPASYIHSSTYVMGLVGLYSCAGSSSWCKGVLHGESTLHSSSMHIVEQSMFDKGVMVSMVSTVEDVSSKIKTRTVYRQLDPKTLSKHEYTGDTLTEQALYNHRPNTELTFSYWSKLSQCEPCGVRKMWDNCGRKIRVVLYHKHVPYQEKDRVQVWNSEFHICREYMCVKIRDGKAVF